MHAEVWVTWWTFAFAIAFLLVGLGAGMRRPMMADVRRPRTA